MPTLVASKLYKTKKFAALDAKMAMEGENASLHSLFEFRSKLILCTTARKEVDTSLWLTKKVVPKHSKKLLQLALTRL